MTSRRRARRAGLAGLALAACLPVHWACGRVPAGLRAQPVPPPARGESQAAVRYLGASGLSIRLGRDSILTGPFFSNPGFLRMLFLPIAPDPERLPEDVDGITRDARAILVGHSHYDHLLDVPLIARRLPPGATIYASRTAGHILAGADLGSARVEAVNEAAGDHDRPGRWIRVPGGAVRFMAIRSGHADHFAGMRFFDGRYWKDWKKLPRFASQWRLGQPFTFVIDFMDPATGRPSFRIFYQDAVSEPPLGLPPPLDDGKGYDLAVLCVASFSRVRGHPEAFIRQLRPRAVLLTHWENFFRPRSRPAKAVPGTDIGEFVRRLEAVLPPGTPWWMPEPGTTVRLAVEAGGPRSRGMPRP